MHDLIVLPATEAGSLSVSEIEDVLDFARASKAESTLACYESDWKDFAAWVTFRGGCPLPCPPALICAYLSHCARSGLKASTIGRRLASIAHYHKQGGCDPSPTSTEAVKTVMQGIRRKLGTAPDQKSPLVADLVRDILKVCDSSTSMIGLRDAALISFGFISAMRRSEICALRVEDLTETADGYRVRIARSKTDPEGKGQEIAIPRGKKIRAVERMQAWLAAANITSGLLFRPVRLGGEVIDKKLREDDLAKLLKRRVRQIGLDPRAYAGHSLRSGFVTTAIEANAPIMRVAEQTRHRDLSMLQVYSRRANLFVGHASETFG
jgi:integrase